MKREPKTITLRSRPGAPKPTPPAPAPADVQMKCEPLTLTEIAARISRHLARFEADLKINETSDRGLRLYYHAHAGRGGAYVRVRYVSYQGCWPLRRDEAERYLAKLDAGFVGRHFEALR